jgi:hypothetical protein
MKVMRRHPHRQYQPFGDVWLAAKKILPRQNKNIVNMEEYISMLRFRRNLKIKKLLAFCVYSHFC